MGVDAHDQLTGVRIRGQGGIGTLVELLDGAAAAQIRRVEGIQRAFACLRACAQRTQPFTRDR
ncbi:MAG: hypothetical protein NVS3B1_26560 [Marmoricola sp.]